MNSGKVFLSILAAAVAGTAVGILVAPDKGINTRKKISKKGNRYMEDMKDTFNEFLENLTQKLESVKEDTDSLFEKGKSKSLDLKKEVQNAMVEQK